MINNFFKDIFKEKINILGLFIAFVCAYMTIPNYFELNLMPLSSAKELWLSLDPSWGISLNYFKIKNLTWGSDIAFTYGPLSHLCTRVGWGENKFSFLFFDIFIFLNYLSILFISFKKSSNKIITTLIILGVSLIIPIWIGATNAIVLMLMLCFWIRLSLDKPRGFYYLFQVIIVTLLFYIKFNTGLIVLPLFYSGIFCNLWYKNGNKILIWAYSIIPIILIVLLSFPLKVSLFDYIKSGIEIISGYNDVMFLENQIPNSLSYVLFIVLALVSVIIFNLLSFNNKKWIRINTVLFLFSTSLFVIYKQAFVRADMGHIKEFFIHIPLLILCNIDFHKRFKYSYLKIILLLGLITPFYFTFVYQETTIEIKSKFSKDQYIKRFNTFNETSGLFIYNNNIPLPEDIKARIGLNTVDVYPWNIQLLIENKLNYLPRPAFQSYTAYTPFLEELNFKHYNSSKAPEYVIYDFASIDGRYPLFDESKINLVLLRNYKLAEVFDYDNRKVVLLKKKTNFSPIRFEKVREYAMILNTTLTPKKDIYYEIVLYPNVFAKINTIFTHAPEIRLEIQLEDGNRADYRTSKLLLESGFFSEKFVANTENFADIFGRENKNQEIKNYKIRPLKASLFKNKIRVIEYKIIQ